MEGRGKKTKLVAATLLLCSLLVLEQFSSAAALNVGVNPSSPGVTVTLQCSRTCESEHCALPPLLRYGKYCGLLYSGCPGEMPCDGLDGCCMIHDACIRAKNSDYLDRGCNQGLLNCITAFRRSGRGTFPGNKCSVEEVVDVLSLVMRAALLAGRIHHP